MSYILDALRRADAERERERSSVPSLHAQAVPTMSSDDTPPRKGGPMVWVVASLSLALLISIAWQFTGREAGHETTDVAVAQAPMHGDTAQAVVSAPPPATLPPVAAPPAPVSTLPARKNELPPVPAAAPAPLPALAQVAKVTPGTASAVEPPPAPAASDSARIPTQEELPADVRRQLPKFVVGGSIYSESAASRFLILNGQIFHENDKVMPDLVLEQIKLKAAVLRYKNQRFSISY